MGGWKPEEQGFRTSAEETVRQAMMEDAARRMKEEFDMQDEFCGGEQWTNAEMSAMLERVKAQPSIWLKRRAGMVQEPKTERSLVKTTNPQ